MGMFIYADDIILLAPSRNGLQNMEKMSQKMRKIYEFGEEVFWKLSWGG